MSKTFVPVKEFRNKIDFAYDALRCHWHACVGDREQVRWFINAIDRFNQLNATDCKRAKIYDRTRYEQVMDLFSAHCDKHRPLWLKARLEIGSITEEQYHAVLLLETASPSTTVH